MDVYMDPRKGVLSGTVRDLVSGEPIPGILVWYAGRDRTSTDADGTFSFTHYWGVDRLLLRGTDDHDEIDTHNQPAGVAIYRGRTSVMDFWLEPRKGNLTGTVYDVVSGLPVPGISVWYAGWDRVTTDQNGTYSFRYYHGVARLLLRGTDDHDEIDTHNQPAGVALYRGKTSVMDFHMMPRKGGLSGTVHDVVSGRPVSGISVWYAGWDRAITDANGTYSFRYYHGSDRLLLRVTDDHDSIDTHNQPAGVAIYRGKTSVMDFYMEPRKGTLSGTVRDAVTGAPVAGVTLWYAGRDRVTTDANGTYSFQFYHGMDRLLVRESDAHHGWDTLGNINGVAIYRGTRAAVDIFVLPKPAPSTGTIAGRVFDLATGLLVNATFMMGGKTAAADGNGTFSLTLPAGPNALSISADGYETRTMQVSVPVIRTTKMDFWLTLLNGTGRFSGTVVDKSGNRTIPGAQVSLYCGWPEPLSFNLTAGADGSFSSDLPTRSYAITVTANGFRTFDGGVTVLKDRTATRKLLLDRDGNFTPWPAELELVSLPEHGRFFIGDLAALEVRLRNIGDLVGEAEVDLSVPGIHDGLGTAWILPNSEDVVLFEFPVPDDLEEKRYKVRYTVLGATYERNITLVGMKLDVSASLDKRMYLAGDTATLTMAVRNLKNFDGQFFSRVRFGDSDTSTPFNLSAGGNATLTFQVPVRNATLERMFYSVYFASGRSLYINSMQVPVRNATLERMFYSVYFASGRSLYINSMQVLVKPAGDVALYTDRPLYRMGETAVVSLESASTGPVNVSTDWFSTTVDPATTKSLAIPVPKLRSGTYFITYVHGSFRGTCPIDVDGYSARVTRADFKQASLDVGGEAEITLDARSNLDLQGTLSTTVIDPQGNEVGHSGTPWALHTGENRGTFPVSFERTEQTGIHSIAYTLYVDLDGKRTPLFSGRKAFDAVDTQAPNVTDTFQSKNGTSSVVITVYTSERTTLVVDYGADQSYGRAVVSTLPGRIHSVVLSNLSAGKTYHYRVTATDLSGNEVVYRDMTAKTSVPVAVQPGTDPLLAMALVVVVIGTVIGAMVIRRRPR